MPTQQPLPTQNWLDLNVNLYTREVTLGTSFGTMPPHVKRGDQRELRVRFFTDDGKDPTTAQQLAQIDYLRFGAKEKGRYDDGPYVAFGEAEDFVQEGRYYPIEITLDNPTLLQLLSQQLQQDFDDDGFDLFGAFFASDNATTTTTIGTAGDTTETTDDDSDDAETMPLLDVEFMAEFEWSQSLHIESSQTFSFFIARDVISDAAANGGSIDQPANQPTDWRFLAALVSEGTTYQDEVFGFFHAPQDCEVLGLQVAIQGPDTAQGFRVQLTDASGNDLGSPAGSQFYGDVPVGTRGLYLPFGQVLALAQGDEIRARVKNYAGTDAMALTVNLMCRRYATNQPAGPSGPPGITSVSAQTLDAGVAASAQIIGQGLLLGLPRGDKGATGQDGTLITDAAVTFLAPNSNPVAALEVIAPGSSARRLHLSLPSAAPGQAGRSVTGVQLSMVAPDASASASLTDAGVLLLNIPRAAPATQAATVTGHVRVEQVQYVAAETDLATLAFTGRGKPATLWATFQNGDTLTFNQDKVRMRLYRSDSQVPICVKDELVIPGDSSNLQLVYPELETLVGDYSYRLTVQAFQRLNGGFPPRPGIAQGIEIKISEPGS